MTRLASPTSDRVLSDGPAFEQVPVSFPQQLLRFLELLRPGTVESSTFNVASPNRIRGPLDMEALRAAADDLVERHEMLRTAVHWSVGVPYQEVAPPMPCPWSIESLEAPTSAVPDPTTAFIDRVRATSFDPAVPPLVRIAVGRCAADDHLLVIGGHHSALDAWSLELLVSELGALYIQRVHGGPPLSEPYQYRACAIAEQRASDSAEVQATIEFWTNYLDGVQPTSFPADRPASRRGPAGKQLLSFPLGADLVKEIHALARAKRMTAFTVFLAAYCLALSEESGARDVVVPVITAGRDDHRTHSCVGFFVNAFLFRADVDADDPGAVLDEVRRRSLDMYRHDSVSIVRVIEAATDAALMLGDEGFALFPFQLVQRAPVLSGPDFGPDVQCEVVVADSDSAMGGLAQPLDGLFTVAGNDGGMTGVVLYEPSRFDRATIDRIARRYEDALRRFLSVRCP